MTKCALLLAKARVINESTTMSVPVKVSKSLGRLQIEGYGSGTAERHYVYCKLSDQEIQEVLAGNSVKTSADFTSP